MLDERFYVQQVEKTIAKLRARCLGQDRLLVDILPPYMKEKPAREQAHYLAAQLLFALLRAEGHYVDAVQQQQCRRWLEGMILYLLEEVAEEDRQFAQLVQLMELPREVRSIMLCSFPDADDELRTGDPPRLLREQLDLAIWWLLGVQGKQKPAQDLVGRVREM